MTWALFAPLLIGLGLSGVLCRISLAAFKRLDLLDRPGSEAHKQQRRSVPYGGGVAMAVALALTVIAVRSWHPLGGASGPVPTSFYPVLAGAAGLFVLGQIDDRRPLPAWFKLSLQLVIITAAVTAGGLTVDVILVYPAAAVLLAVLWCVLIANAYNLLDHADGMSGSIATVSLVVLVSASLSAGDFGLAQFHLALIGVVGGFLIWNLPPARMYMGDAGSLPLGFLIGAGCLQTTFWDSDPATPGSPAAVLAPLLVSAIPLYDTAVVVIKRLRHRRAIMQGDRNHISHRLARLGLDDRGTLATVVALQTALAAGALLLRRADPTTALVVILQTASVVLVAILLEARRDRYR